MDLYELTNLREEIIMLYEESDTEYSKSFYKNEFFNLVGINIEDWLDIC